MLSIASCPLNFDEKLTALKIWLTEENLKFSEFSSADEIVCEISKISGRNCDEDLKNSFEFFVESEKIKNLPTKFEQKTPFRLPIKASDSFSSNFPMKIFREFLASSSSPNFEIHLIFVRFNFDDFSVQFEKFEQNEKNFFLFEFFNSDGEIFRLKFLKLENVPEIFSDKIFNLRVSNGGTVSEASPPQIAPLDRWLRSKGIKKFQPLFSADSLFVSVAKFLRVENFDEKVAEFFKNLRGNFDRIFFLRADFEKNFFVSLVEMILRENPKSEDFKSLEAALAVYGQWPGENLEKRQAVFAKLLELFENKLISSNFAVDFFLFKFFQSFFHFHYEDIEIIKVETNGRQTFIKFAHQITERPKKLFILFEEKFYNLLENLEASASDFEAVDFLGEKFSLSPDDSLDRSDSKENFYDLYPSTSLLSFFSGERKAETFYVPKFSDDFLSFFSCLTFLIFGYEDVPFLAFAEVLEFLENGDWSGFFENFIAEKFENFSFPGRESTSVEIFRLELSRALDDKRLNDYFIFFSLCFFGLQIGENFLIKENESLEKLFCNAKMERKNRVLYGKFLIKGREFSIFAN